MSTVPPFGADPAVTLARIEVKLDAVLRQGDDHEGRIRQLESDRTPRWKVDRLLAAFSSVAAVAAVIVAVLR